MSLAAALVHRAVGCLEAAGLGGDPIAVALRGWLHRPAGALEPRWSRYYLPSAWAAPFLDKLAVTRLAATDGLAFGAFVVSPGVDYPEHCHDARELYLTLAGQPQFLSEQGWADLPPGSPSIQEPGVVHALRSGAVPAAFFWAWTGAVDSPIWAVGEGGRRFVPPAA